MKNAVSASLVLLIALASCADDTSTDPRGDTPELETRGLAPLFSVPPDRWVSDSYIVVLRDDIEDVDAAAERAAASYGGALKHIYRAALKGFAITIPSSAVEALRTDRDLQYVAMDARGRSTSTPWNLDRLDQLDPVWDRKHRIVDNEGAEEESVPCTDRDSPLSHLRGIAAST
jgi:hypothetical protein